ncbi:MAG: SDR family NAD(P)-dependent oxidoreductase [Gemmatimonadales bacterium]|nr:SDR family NAD(P)-dependent oxidoreductase [Gemmatimonadales bacterium]
MSQPTKRLAIVTGTSSGIGEALAQQLLDQGWTVVGIARRAGRLAHPQFRHVALDLSAVGDLTAALDASVGPMVRDSTLSRIGLVNNAADVALLGQLERVDPTAMLSAFATNTVAPTVLAGWLLRTAAPSIPLRIVNVSSGAAIDPFPGMGAYAASKAGLRMTGMILAVELDARGAEGDRDATIWSYEPGVVATPMQEAVRSSSADTVPIVQVFKDLHAGGQLRDPAAPAAEIAAYLNGDGHPRFSERRFILEP